MKFRYDINLLRAVAVIAVIFYHFKIPLFSGGFLGVDVFFVISGYLMSKIILDGFDNSKFSLKDFYSRRVKRIIPELLVLIVFVLIAGSILLFPNELKLLSQYALSSILFVSNIFYWLGSGYFDPSSKNNLLLHTWSLSVEWQFYMIYPLLLMLLRRIYLVNRRLFTVIITFFLIGSFVVTVIISQQHNSFAFYLFPTRSWEMAIGCLIFLFEKNIQGKLSGIARNRICLVGYFVLFGSIFLFTEKLNWPGIYTSIPVVSTALIVLCNADFGVSRNRIIQSIGKMSYSLYLWHWPLYVFATGMGFNSFGYVVAILVLTFFLAYLSNKFMELNNRVFSIKRISLFAVGLSSVCFCLNLNPVNKYFIDKELIALSDHQQEHKEEIKNQMNIGTCFLYSASVYQDFSKVECLTISDSKKNNLLFGDSHAAQFSVSLRKKFASQNINVLQATTSQCFPFLNAKGREENVKLVEYMLGEFIPKNSNKIDKVIISANWIEEKGYTKEELKTNILELIDYLHSLKIKVKIIGQLETYSSPYPSIAAKEKRFFSKNLDEFFIEEVSYEMNDYLKSFLPDDIYIDVYRVNGLTKLLNNTPYMYDSNHLTEFGADQVIDYVYARGLL